MKSYGTSIEQMPFIGLMPADDPATEAIAKTQQYRLPVFRVQLVRESSLSSAAKEITNPRSVSEIAGAYLSGVDREHLIVLLLDTKNHVIGINTVSVGDLSSSIAHPREVFKPAILAGAAAIILAHNHPSGDPAPSSEDVAVTRRLMEAGKILGIELLDHVVIGQGVFVSLKERGKI